MLGSAALVACGGGGGDASTGGDQGGGLNTEATTATEDTSANLVRVVLDAFRDFSCTSGWGNRNGALGRLAFSGSGSCTAAFNGPPGRYRVTLQAQIEFDGSSPYRISLNGNTIKEGRFPYSEGSLRCDCPEPWRTNCPERVIDIGAGTHQINTGDSITFWGDDVYPCGNDTHGSYAKWRSITLEPV